MRAVPEEPTQEMIDAGCKLASPDAMQYAPALKSALHKVYKAMLAAAPAPVGDGLAERLRVCASSMEDVANAKNIEGWATLLEHVDVIREAAAALQSRDEPVAWRIDALGEEGKTYLTDDSWDIETAKKNNMLMIPLYATPPRKP